MANNPLETGQVIPRNVGLGCHFSFPLSPFLNTATWKETRTRSLKARVPALYSLVSDSLDDISSLYSAAIRIILWVIYDFTNQSQQLKSLDYLLFVCTKRMRIVSTISMVQFMLSLQKMQIITKSKAYASSPLSNWSPSGSALYTVFHKGQFPNRVYASLGKFLLVMRPKHLDAYLTCMNSWKLLGHW